MIFGSCGIGSMVRKGGCSVHSSATSSLFHYRRAYASDRQGILVDDRDGDKGEDADNKEEEENGTRI